MDVREKLVELIEKASYECDEGTRDLWDMREVADGIADFLIAHGVTVQGWIPVEERLPERNTEVLVCDTREDYVSVWEHMGDGLWYGNDIIWATEDITHWMPLPQPPEGE